MVRNGGMPADVAPELRAVRARTSAVGGMDWDEFATPLY
jgi:hypothetical protein